MFRSHTLSDQVYDHLLSSISSGRLPAGTRRCASGWNPRRAVGRQPHPRSARPLARLAECGLVEVLTSRSTRVRPPGPTAVTWSTSSPSDTCWSGSPSGWPATGSRTTTCGGWRRLALSRPPGGRTRSWTPATSSTSSCTARSCAGDRATRSLEAEIRKLHDLTQLVHKPVADRPHRLNREVRQHLQILDRLKARDRGGAASRPWANTCGRSACRYMRWILRADQTPDRANPVARRGRRGGGGGRLTGGL